MSDEITVQTENLLASLPGLQPLLEEHYRELALFQEEIPLAINWPYYYSLVASKQLLFVTARASDGKLLGYYILTTPQCPHYFTTPKAVHDIMRVLPERAGTGSA